MVPVKDVELLGKLIRTACGSLYKIRFLVVGDGEERQKLESLIEGCNNAKLIGWQKNIDWVWSAADMALLTSRNEGTPTALIEGMAAGRPFVATNVGGVKDIAVGPLSALPRAMGYRAQNGFLTLQTPEALLYGIEQLAGNAPEAKQMASVGRAFVLERFSANRLIRELNALYQYLLAPRQEAAKVSLPRSEANS
jgi:glycosyltransferase involved in cell wall biosynthesis